MVVRASVPHLTKKAGTRSAPLALRWPAKFRRLKNAMFSSGTERLPSNEKDRRLGFCKSSAYKTSSIILQAVLTRMIAGPFEPMARRNTRLTRIDLLRRIELQISIARGVGLGGSLHRLVRYST